MSLQTCVCLCSLHLKHLGLLKFDIIILFFLLEAWNNLLKHTVFVKLTFVLAGCCLDMLMGSQRFKLYICWITGLELHCVYFKRSLYIYICWITGLTLHHVLSILKALFCIVSASIFNFPVLAEWLASGV